MLVRTTTEARRLAKQLAAACALATGAAAQTTYTVGPGPQFDFATIGDALTVAGPFDLVDVFPGTYPPFTMDSPSRVMGRPGAEVTGDSVVRDIPSNRWALVADLELERLRVEDAEGTVVLAGLETTARNASLVLDRSDDVRVDDLDATPGIAGVLFGHPNAVVVARSSRVQVTNSVVRAGGPAQEGDYGQAGIDADAGSFVHVTGSEVEGGDGGDGLQLLVYIEPGDGAPGVRVRGGSHVRVVRSTVRGGVGGFDPEPPFDDGEHGPGLEQCGGDSDAWDSVFEGGASAFSTSSPAPDTLLICGATLSITEDLPAFQIAGAVVPGGSVDLVCSAGAGASMRIIVGRFPVRVPTPGTTIPRLVDLGRNGSLGAVPASGEFVLPTSVPNWPRGSVMFLQVSRTNGFGSDFSNGGCFLVR